MNTNKKLTSPVAKPEGGKKIALKGIDGRFFSMPKEEYDYGNWYVTGWRKKHGRVDESLPMWVSKDIDQAEYFTSETYNSNYRSGEILYSKPKKGIKVLDLTDDQQLIDFADEINRLAEKEHADFSRIVREYEELGAKDISEVLLPDDIVEYGKVWDDSGFISSVSEIFGYDFIKTTDGGIFLNPGEAAWITKRKPLNFGKEKIGTR